MTAPSALFHVLLAGLLWACTGPLPPEPESGPGRAPALDPPPVALSDPVRFLALGDSYTIGSNVPAAARWPEQLRDSLRRRGATFDSLAILAKGGWKSDDLIEALEADNPPDDWNLVSLLIGVNDAFLGVDTAVYRPRYLHLVDEAVRLAGGDPGRVLVVSIPDFAYTPYGQGWADPTQISERLDDFNSINRAGAEVAGARWIGIVDISRRGLDEPGLVAGDGLHPSGLQYALWVERMLPDVTAILAE